jgi:hypothetical protein
MTLRSVRLRHDSMGWAADAGEAMGRGGESAITLLTPLVSRGARKESVGKKAVRLRARATFDLGLFRSHLSGTSATDARA